MYLNLIDTTWHILFYCSSSSSGSSSSSSGSSFIHCNLKAAIIRLLLNCLGYYFVFCDFLSGVRKRVTFVLWSGVFVFFVNVFFVAFIVKAVIIFDVLCHSSLKKIGRPCFTLFCDFC